MPSRPRRRNPPSRRDRRRAGPRAHRWRASRATAAVHPGCDCPTRETLRGAPPRSRSHTIGRAAAPRGSPSRASRSCPSRNPAPPRRLLPESGCPASARAQSRPRGRGRTRLPGRAGCARPRRPGARSAPSSSRRRLSLRPASAPARARSCSDRRGRRGCEDSPACPPARSASPDAPAAARSDVDRPGPGPSTTDRAAAADRRRADRCASSCRVVGRARRPGPTAPVPLAAAAAR